MADPIVKCAFCGKTAPLKQALEDAWYPNVHTDADTQSDMNLCRECGDEHLDDDLIVKKGHMPPTIVVDATEAKLGAMGEAALRGALRLIVADFTLVTDWEYDDLLRFYRGVAATLNDLELAPSPPDEDA